MSDVALLDASRAARPCRLVEWKPWPFDSPSLIGHATVSFAGWVMTSIPVFRKAESGGLSVGVPSIPQIDTEGRVRMKDGKRVYTALMNFENAEARERWNRSVLAALTAAGIGK
jgi:hypothetical protein